MMPPTETATLQYNLAHPRAPWVMPPTLPGAWTEQTGEDAVSLLRLIGASHQVDDLPFTLALHLDRVRTRPLACYGGVMLVEAQGYDPAPGIAAFILHEGGVLRLDGRSQPIHDFNGETGPQLETDEARSDYALLFMNWVHGSEGRFQPLVADAAFAHRLLSGEEKASGLVDEHRLDALAFEEQTDVEQKPSWCATMPVLYSNTLFQARMRILPDGTMVMEDDEPQVADLPLLIEMQQGPLIRLATPQPEGETP